MSKSFVMQLGKNAGNYLMGFQCSVSGIMNRSHSTYVWDIESSWYQINVISNHRSRVVKTRYSSIKQA